MKVGLYLLVLTLLSSDLFQDDPDCIKFREGVFYIPFEQRIGKSYHIYRLMNNQVEIDNDRNETYITIKWLSDCSYVAYLDPESKEVIKQTDPNMVTDSTIVVFKKISGDTLFYKATSYFGEKKINYQGKMIRLGDVPPRD